MRRDSVFVNLSAFAQRPGVDFFLRQGQQYVRFYRKPGGSLQAEVSVDGGAWDMVQGPTSRRYVDWQTPPTTLGKHSVGFRWLDSGYWHTYYIDLYVVLPAVRRFESSDYATYSGGGLPNDIIDRSDMLLWTMGTDAYTQQDRPLLVVEGIDADNKNSAATYLALGSNTTGNRPALFPLSLSNGADVAILDFADGGADMAYNARVVEGAIRYWRDHRSRPDVGFAVVGVSMGGVVARYALAEMEGWGEAHGASHFVSLDAPQRGAVIDGRLQRDIKALKEGDEGLAVPRALTSTAGMQLLPNAAFDNTSPSRHQRFYDSLRALNGGTGYPQQTDNIGVSFGAPLAPATSGQVWLLLDVPQIYNVDPSKWAFCGNPIQYPICPDKEYDLVGDVAVAGSRLPKDIASQWGPVLHLFTYNLDRDNRPDPVFIPRSSALDLESGQQAFDVTFSADTTRFHDVVPDEIAIPVLSRMGYLTPPPPQAPLAVGISGPFVVPSNPGTWTGWMNRPQPHGFTFTWSYRLDLTGACGIDDEPLLRSAPTSQKKPGGGETNLINQCVWTSGPSGPTFSYSVAGNAWLDVKVTATNGSQEFTTTRRVTYGSGGGGPLLSVQEASVEVEGEAEAFEVSTVRPSAVTAGAPVRLTVGLVESSNVKIAVYDVLGRVQHRRIESFPQGRHAVEIPSTGLVAGSYVVSVRSGREQRTARFIVNTPGR